MSIYNFLSNSFFFKSTQAQSLTYRLNSFQIEEIDMAVVNQAIGCLAIKSDNKLQQAVKNIFDKVSIPLAKSLLNSIVAEGLSSGRLKMIDTCKKVISLDLLKKLSGIESPSTVAKAESLIAPKSLSNMQALSKSIFQYVNTNSGYFGKLTRYFSQTVFLAYNIDVDDVPESHKEATHEFYALKDLFDSVLWISTQVIEYINSYIKIGAFALGALISIIGLRSLYVKFQMGTPENLNSIHFRNLNTEAKISGSKKQTIGRDAEAAELEAALSFRSGGPRCNPILVGPAGVGKTQLMEGLALKINQKNTRSLNDKQILAINSASLTSGASFRKNELLTRLESIFNMLKGHEDKFILFFDEAHNLAGSYSIGALNGATPLQALKDKLLTVPVQCVFATTNAEYEKHIASDSAFKSRLFKIDIAELSDSETKTLLQEKYGLEIDIDSQVYDEVLNIAKNQEGANPRKSEQILTRAQNYLHAWKPKLLDKQVLDLNLKLRAEETIAKQSWHNDPSWIQSIDGINTMASIESLKKEKVDLEKQLSNQINLCRKIDTLTRYTKDFREKYYGIIHILNQNLARNALIETEKEYLLLKTILLPQALELQKCILKELADMNEHMPTSVSLNILKEMYPQTA